MPNPQFGIALRKTRTIGGRICYEVVETSPNRRDISLAVRADDDDIIAIWRSLARDKNLPLLIEYSDGRREAVSPMLGGIIVGPYRPHRRPIFTTIF